MKSPQIDHCMWDTEEPNAPSVVFGSGQMTLRVRGPIRTWQGVIHGPLVGPEDGFLLALPSVL